MVAGVGVGGVPRRLVMMAMNGAGLDRDAIREALRQRLRVSNFNANLHEPVRTQTIDIWADVLAGAVVAIAEPVIMAKAEAWEQGFKAGVRMASDKTIVIDNPYQERP